MDKELLFAISAGKEPIKQWLVMILPAQIVLLEKPLLPQEQLLPTCVPIAFQESILVQQLLLLALTALLDM